ncbi:hypothetical protein [Hydrogenoanaerobacterium saccharovorans]|uniref:Uncharacterized protein n=1 Tax=Hydrogenoanaerobacterium saccharovorans TaxID=474960 RepID=A0A1H8DK90_9FIRM|nr:hypothetical protein [Hydrogenoanaerobacterium saccharovorans]SEN07732.1 hypothetical protein SAMN05216180_2657 [Hydrogenoanaerobacterium saccharovorans]
MNNILTNSKYEDKFSTISEFKWCIDDGGEVEFIWKGKPYSITHPDGKISISEAYKQETESVYNTTDELLEYMVGGDRLHEVTQVEVLCRTI